MWKSTVMSMPRVGLWICTRKCTVGCWLAVAPQGWSWWWKKVRVVPVFEENSLGNDGLVSVTSAHRNVIVWILTKAVSSSTSRHRKGGNIIENSHTDLSGTCYMWPTSLVVLMRWDEQHWMRGGKWRCPCQGKGKPCWVAGAGAAQTPLCQRSRAAAAAAAHEALVALETLQCRETTEGNKKPGDFQVTHEAHLCSSESAKAQGFHVFLSTARLCVEVWTHLGVYITVETLQHSEICCLLLFSWVLIAAAKNEELVKGYENVHSYILFTLLELLIWSVVLAE